MRIHLVYARLHYKFSLQEMLYEFALQEMLKGGDPLLGLAWTQQFKGAREIISALLATDSATLGPT